MSTTMTTAKPRRELPPLMQLTEAAADAPAQPLCRR